MTTEPTWLLSDGTKVRLGGRVDGNGPAAGVLRYDLEALREGAGATVPMYGWRGGVELDVNDIKIVHAWVRDRVRFADATIVSAPEAVSAKATESVHPAAPFLPGRVY